MSNQRLIDRLISLHIRCTIVRDVRSWRLVQRCKMLWTALVMFVVCLRRTSPVTGKLSTSRMSPRVVETVQGKLRAVLVTRPELDLPPVEVYLGVQYASTLGAELRFMPPTASIEKWDGVRVALKHRPVCPQRLSDLDQPATGTSSRRRLQHLQHLLPFVEKQSEDCLNLNIFVSLTGKPTCSLHSVRRQTLGSQSKEEYD